MTIRLPAAVETALSRLNRAGWDAFVVGGCVRDSLRGEKPQDWDITTAASPQVVMRVFADLTTVPTGLAHGTVTVIVDEMPLEITTYRVDGTYTDHRHPDAVCYTDSLAEDLRRRDFTINAMAYHPEKGLVDLYSGAADLERRRIVCVGDPEQRFTEDALRILRALRFSSALDFPIERMTAAAIHRLAPLLHRVAAERVAAELKKLLCGRACRRVLLEFPDVLGVVIPELLPTVGLRQENPYHHLTVYEHTVETVQAVEPFPVLRFAMLFHDIGKPQCYTRDLQGIDHFRGHSAVGAAIAGRVLERLRLDRKTVEDVTLLVMHHDDELTEKPKHLRRLIHRFGPERALWLVELHRADVLGQHPDKRDRLAALARIQKEMQRLIDENACCSLAQLAIGGDDLVQLGYAPGKKLGDILRRLLEAVIEEEIPNDRASLLQKAAEWL